MHKDIIGDGQLEFRLARSPAIVIILKESDLEILVKEAHLLDNFTGNGNAEECQRLNIRSLTTS